MKDVLICVLSRAGISETTRQCLVPLVKEGAELMTLSGCSDVSYGRSTLLSRAVDAGRPQLLLVDDDMVFRFQDASHIIGHSRDHGGTPVSAVYATAGGRLAAVRNWDSGRPWLTGLGFFTVGLSHMQKCQKALGLPTVWSMHDGHITAWCESWADPENNRWVNEDLDFCLKLGGVDLLPIGVGHLKTIPLYPDAETLQTIESGGELPKEKEQ